MEYAVELKQGERLDDLQHSGLRLIQHPDAFRFGTDSVLLADFAAPKRSDKTVDLGCGTGAIAMLMAAHCPGLHVDAVEIQPEIADMARRSVKLNDMEAQMTVHEMDMREAWRTLGAEKFNVVVCNPPYGKKGAVLLNENDAKRIARHEGDLTAEDVARSASKLLKSGGKLCVVYPAERAFQMMQAMSKNRLAPKRIRTVHGVEGRAPRFVLLDAVKDGGEQLHWMEPLVLRNKDGDFTSEWKRIYRMEETEHNN